MLKKRKFENFRITSDGFFWKILKVRFSENLPFPLIPCHKPCC